MERDLDIVLLTGKELEEKILPFGRLREPLEVLKERGDYCLLTKGKNSDLENFCSRLGKPYGYLKLEGFKFLLNGSEEINFKNLKGKRLGLISAVGDNSAFKRQVEDLLKNYGFRLEKIYQFRDHCDYRGFQLEGNYIWITTFKDFVKLENRGTFVVVDRIFQLPEDLKDLILKKVKTFER
jgi:tetraacyldisaccharide 4'-kinase